VKAIVGVPNGTTREIGYSVDIALIIVGNGDYSVQSVDDANESTTCVVFKFYRITVAVHDTFDFA
jgi:hypothetical protein